ncbi:hypothetical protein OUZ56_030524 [Daphnia magna]|uniref:Uncharacterized protein n=1 Tax=Daphnia magna TaxID=35525 RepID=A0ABQ9ZSH4_9CRUS|nr:hypothetical protein OUZ56_030524 [Daphnia magna]
MVHLTFSQHLALCRVTTSKESSQVWQNIHALTMALCPAFTIFIGGANRCWKCKHEVEEILRKFG